MSHSWENHAGAQEVCSCEPANTVHTDQRGMKTKSLVYTSYITG